MGGFQANSLGKNGAILKKACNNLQAFFVYLNR